MMTFIPTDCVESPMPEFYIVWHNALSDAGIPFETMSCLSLKGTLVVYFTTSNLCAEEFIESLARNKGLPALTLATDSTHHIWSFEVGS